MKALFYVKISGDGDGSGSGSGSGSGDGYGYGYGDGSGSGYGYGYGDGDGDGSGSGDGDGDGDGSGSGYGYGDGYGDGSVEKIKSINGKPMDYIDGIPTIIHSHRGNLAKGVIVDLSDYTETPTWVARHNGVYAHGKTARKAASALEAKLFESMPTEERIAEFRKEHPTTTAVHPARHFFNWHFKLTGSCEQGRESFARSHSIDLDKGTMTVAEFIHLTENAYGGEVLRQLKQTYGTAIPE